MHMRQIQASLLAAGCTVLAGCSIISPVPVWEVFKASTAAASVLVASSQGKASDTIYHLHSPFSQLCIEFNPAAEVPDVIPALQLELRNHGVESRVYEARQQVASCEVWLRYAAAIEWGIPTLSGTYRPYINRAALTLQRADGLVLSSSNYVLDEGFSSSKWASVRDKLAPSVTALLTGVENVDFYKCANTSTVKFNEGKEDANSRCTR
jgi:hypothetical protein